MMIGKITPTPMVAVQDTRKVKATEGVYSAPDSINISDEARKAYEMHFVDQVAKETPDVREDLVASIREKIKDPNYLNPERISATADAVMSAYGLL